MEMKLRERKTQCMKGEHMRHRTAKMHQKMENIEEYEEI